MAGAVQRPQQGKGHPLAPAVGRKVAVGDGYPHAPTQGAGAITVCAGGGLAGASGRESRLVPPAPEGAACGRPGGGRCTGGGERGREIVRGLRSRGERGSLRRPVRRPGHGIQPRGPGAAPRRAAGGRRLWRYSIGDRPSPGRDGLRQRPRPMTRPGGFPWPGRPGPMGRPQRRGRRGRLDRDARGAALGLGGCGSMRNGGPWQRRALPAARTAAPAVAISGPTMAGVAPGAPRQAGWDAGADRGLTRAKLAVSAPQNY